MTPSDQLDALLARFGDLVERHPIVLTESPLNAPEHDRLYRELLFRFQGEPPLPAAYAWWTETEQRIDRTMLDTQEAELRKLAQLYILLGALDAHFGAQALVALQTEEGVRLIGRRWWNYHEYESSGRDPLERAPFSVRSPFPHLVRGQLRAAEWVSGRRITRAFHTLLERQELRIALCTLNGKAQTRFTGTDVLDRARGIFGFKAFAVEPSHHGGSQEDVGADSLEEIRACVQWATAQGAHLLVFPELCLDPAALAAVRAELESAPGELCLVAPGSFHLPDSANPALVVNACPILAIDGRGVAELCTVEKSEPFLLTVDAAINMAGMSDACEKAEASGCHVLREHIKPGGATRILNTPIGTLGFVICRDALPEDTEHVFGRLRARSTQTPDHLFILSMNANPTAWFWTRAELVARQVHSATYYVNAAQASLAAHSPQPELAFWYLPYAVKGLGADPSGFEGATLEGSISPKTIYFRSLPQEPHPAGAAPAAWPSHGRILLSIPLPPRLIVELG